MVDVITTPKTRTGHILLPWQQLWRRDTSPVKIWEKSRRIGATYTEACDCVMNRMPGQPRENMDYWFSSADESAAYEFADYCRFWHKKFTEVVASVVCEDRTDERTGKNYTAYVVRVGDARITAMTSNPRRFRSKGGDVGLDEFAYHDDAGAMYEAAEPCTMWGGWLRILSTHNGEASEFNRFCKMGRRVATGEGRSDDIPFSIHRITLPEAVEQGLVECINETKNTSFTREGFLADRRKRCRTEDHWQQEYMAVPAIDSQAWLPYDLIEACSDPKAGNKSLTTDGQRYIGMDIGENNDRTVICDLELVGDILWCRDLQIFTDEPLAIKEQALLAKLADPRVVRACIDGTGVGAQIGQAAERTGKGESIKFTAASKDSLASPMRRQFEDRRIRVPNDTETREDLHSLRMEKTASGHPRFDAARSKAGHGDRFWAIALARHAAGRINEFNFSIF